MAAAPNEAHRWSFYRAGGVDQVRLDRGADLLHLSQLDQKLWVALSCPVKGLEFDARTLDLLDADRDGHVRPPEILGAVAWLQQVLRSADELTKGADAVPLANLREDTAEGRAARAAAKLILNTLGKEGATSIGVADTLRTAEIFASAQHNGDGVVPPEGVGEPEARQVASEIVECLGGVPDRSGKPGFDSPTLDAFFTHCAAFDAWARQGESDPDVHPFGERTPAALAALEAVRAKCDDYFGRCRLAAFDPRALAALNREEKAYLEVAARDLSLSAQEVRHFPVALVEPGKPLSLQDGLNPAWAGAIAHFRESCCPDQSTLSESEWAALCARLEPHRAWVAAKAGARVEKLGAARVRAILGGKSKEHLNRAIATDLEAAPQVDAIAQVEKLTRLHRDLHGLLNNFVSFSDFYGRRGAIFQAGTLYLDGRSCELCFRVHDMAKHGSLAAMAKAYLVYVDCTRPGSDKMTVACAFTAGDSDNLFVGRNGIFYDRQGRDWDATITKIVDNPISIGQAFWSPYKKLVRWIEEQAAKRAAAADEASAAKLQTAATKTGEAVQSGQAPVQKPRFDVGVIAALGVAVGGIAAALSGVMASFFGLGPWIPFGLIGLILAILGPSMLIAWLKLRQRNLGPILDAGGWAVNALTKVNVPLGRSLTRTRALPPGSQRTVKDPYASKRSPWPTVLLVLLLLGAAGWGLWRRGFLHQWWPECPLPKPTATEAEGAPAAGDPPGG